MFKYEVKYFLSSKDIDFSNLLHRIHQAKTITILITEI